MTSVASISITTKQLLSEYNSTGTTERSLESDLYLQLQAILYWLLKWVPVFYVPFGVVGNITSFLVTTKKSNRNISTCVYMSALSVVDTMVLFSIFGYRTLFVHGLGDAIRDRLNSIV
jgi:hypothetical protein